MYAYIKGILEIKRNDYVVIDNNGIGYKIFTSLSTIDNILGVGEEVKLFTHHYVREDNISLYGFKTMEELSMFELLMSVSGVGPKAAISVLSTITPSKFGLAVITDDAKTLTKAQGIGLKTAQRIILELKDKMKKEQLEDVVGLKQNSKASESNPTVVSEAVSALMVLGYTGQEANNAIAKVYNDGMELEETIKLALKMLVKN